MRAFHSFSTALVVLSLAGCATAPVALKDVQGVEWMVGKAGADVQGLDKAAIVILGDTVVPEKIDGTPMSSLPVHHVNRMSTSRAYFLQLEPGDHTLSVLYRKGNMETRTAVDVRARFSAGEVYRLEAVEPKNATYRIQFQMSQSPVDAPAVTEHVNKLKASLTK
jgi:hypothetical protein